MIKMQNRLPLLAAVFGIAILLGVGRPSSAASLYGYWESWKGLTLASVPANYDVVEIAFALPGGTDNAAIHMPTTKEPVGQIEKDVLTLQSQGKKVLLSIGGQNANNLQLLNGTDRTAFESSVKTIVNKFHLNGIDLDLENGTLALQSGDNDYRHPATPTTVNLIRACNDLAAHYGSSFMITMAPETIDVDAYGFYGGQNGSYLPLIYGIRNVLTAVQIQCYNSGTMYGRDGGIYTEDTPDFAVALSDLLLGGYPMANGQTFDAIEPRQVVFGIPATTASAGGGFLTGGNALKAAKYIGSGTTYGGSYTLSNPSGYPGFGGVMIWNINDDKSGGQVISKKLAPYLHSVDGPGAEIEDSE